MTEHYREQVNAPLWARGSLLAAFTLTAGLLAVQTLTHSAIGQNPAPNSVLFTLSAIFGVVYMLFHKLSINIDARGVQLRYGLMQRKIPYIDIERVELSRIGVVDYGGISHSSGGDKAYSIRSGEAVKLVTRSSGLVLFTPQEPRRVMSLINEIGSLPQL